MSLREYLNASYAEEMTLPVAIFGYGASGRAVKELLGKLGVESAIYDQRVGDRSEVRRNFTEKRAERHRLVIHSPAFGAAHPWIELARKNGCHVLSEIEFAQQLRRGPTLVVTGTNGKTTLQEFITFALKRAGVSAVATGQNAYPLSRLAIRTELDGVTAVCELTPRTGLPLSAFRYDALFWINFHEDHIEDRGERGALFAEYLRLLELSPEAVIYAGPSVEEEARLLGLELPGRVRTAREEDYPDWDLPNYSAFATKIHRPALALFRRYWNDEGLGDSLLKSAAENFEVRAHRLHLCATVGLTEYWNDSKANNFAATQVALENFRTPSVWIGGGHYRGGDLEAFAASIGSHLVGAVLIGDVAGKLAEILKAKGIKCEVAGDLKEAVNAAFHMAETELRVVFSPGFIAGTDYGDFVERGMCFENAVLGLKHWRGGA
jgi:UDP-N-acetylmuramoylalanine--D-glutamate ligase